MNVALTLFRLGDFRAARTLQEKALDCFSRTLPDDHPDLQVARHDLALTLREFRDFHAARALQEKVLDVRSRTLPDDDADLQRARFNLSVTLYKLGDFRAARPLQEKVLEVFSRTLRDDHPDLQAARGNLASTLDCLGDLTTARAMREKVLAISSRTLPDDHPALQLARGKLAGTLRRLGDLPAARALQERVLETLSRTLPGDHPQLQAARENLAITLGSLGDLRGARALQEKALEVFSRTLPEDDLDLQHARGNLAGTLYKLGDLSAARALQEQVLEVELRTLPDDDPSVQLVKYSLGLTLYKLGDLPAARALQEHVLDVGSRTLPDDHPSLIGARHSLARTCARQGDFVSLAPLLADLARSLQASLEGSLAASPREAGERIAGTKNAISILLSLSEFVPTIEPTIFGLIETGRDMAASSAMARTDADPEMEAMARASRELRGQIQDLVTTGGTAADGSVTRAERVSELVRQRDLVEAKLRQRRVDRGVAAPPIELGSVVRALPERSAAIGLRRYKRLALDVEDPSKPLPTEDCLLAFVVSGSGALHRVDLGPVEPIAAAARRWRAAVGKPLERGISGEAVPDDEQAAGGALRALVLDPLLAAAGEVQTLHICLDDALHLVPLDSLPMGDGLVGDRVRIHVESSFGRLVRRSEQTKGEPSLLAIGGVDFNAEVTSRPTAEAAVEPSDANDHSGPLRSNLAPLAQTRAEAENLGELFRGVFDREPVVLTGKKASRTALVETASKARFLHIATHGYFAPESVKSVADESQPDDALFKRMTLEETVTGLAPMTLCGLALAGANRGVDALGRVSGIITAEEIAGLDLSNCELAVLSACETNVGITRAGQGIQSLQAALHAAGARTAITSLWKVDDEATRMLFEDFYTRIWVKHEPKSQALWAAKMSLRKQGRPTRDWAAWVLTGEPE
ncbi:MAG: CHAT domain-containing protein [Planctomycetes bacterium]|nr:CHAT domain-containing protein [Planctomycetota bacterium]